MGDLKIVDSRGLLITKKVGVITGKTVAYLVMGFFAIMAIYPIIWMMINSFKSTNDYRVDKLGLPPTWYPENYQGAWDLGQFGTYIPNSVIYTVIGTLGVVLLALLAGFAFAKLKNKSTGLMYGSFVIGILLSLSSLMVPLFLQLSQFDKGIGSLLTSLGIIGKPTDFKFFYNSRIGVILIYIGSGLPMAVYLATEYIRGIPTSLIEAARIDGAGFFRIYSRIIVPMSAPIATTIAIITLPGIWNEFALINIIVSDNTLKTLPLGIMVFNGERSVDYGKMFAALTVGLLPMLIFYVAFRKQITRGVSGGAVKG